MKNEYLNNLVYMTPKKDKRVIALFSSGVWIEVYQGEVILVHRKRVYELSMLGLEEVEEGKYPELFATESDAEKADTKRFRVIRGV